MSKGGVAPPLGFARPRRRTGKVAGRVLTDSAAASLKRSLQLILCSMPRPLPHTVPPVGAQFNKEYKGALYRLAVIRLPEGGTGYRVNGSTFTSPSTAAKSITGWHVNGWKWWGIEP